VLEVVRESGQSLDALADEVKTFPQKLVNIRVKHRRPVAELHSLQAEIQAAEREFVRRVRERGVSCTVRDTRGREIAAEVRVPQGNPDCALFLQPTKESKPDARVVMPRAGAGRNSLTLHAARGRAGAASLAPGLAHIAVRR